MLQGFYHLLPLQPTLTQSKPENLSFEIQTPLLKSKIQYFPSISHSLFICFLYTQICRFLHFSLSFHKPATRYFEEAEHTTAVKVSTSDPFSFLDSKFIFIFGFIFGFTFNLWWCCFLLCSHRFFFLHVQSEIVVHKFEEKCMSFFFEIPNFLHNPKHLILCDSSQNPLIF
jgi:hypothetical protein